MKSPTLCPLQTFVPLRRRELEGTNVPKGHKVLCDCRPALFLDQAEALDFVSFADEFIGGDLDLRFGEVI